MIQRKTSYTVKITVAANIDNPLMQCEAGYFYGNFSDIDEDDVEFATCEISLVTPIEKNTKFSLRYLERGKQQDHSQFGPQIVMDTRATYFGIFRISG